MLTLASMHRFRDHAKDTLPLRRLHVLMEAGKSHPDYVLFPNGGGFRCQKRHGRIWEIRAVACPATN